MEPRGLFAGFPFFSLSLNSSITNFLFISGSTSLLARPMKSATAPPGSFGMFAWAKGVEGGCNMIGVPECTCVNVRKGVRVFARMHADVCLRMFPP